MRLSRRRPLLFLAFMGILLALTSPSRAEFFSDFYLGAAITGDSPYTVDGAVQPPSILCVSECSSAVVLETKAQYVAAGLEPPEMATVPEPAEWAILALVALALGVALAILTESALSFLGLGFPADFPTWGRLLFDAKDYLQQAPLRVIAPGFMIAITVIAVNFIGDGIRDALDPKLRSK